MALSRFAAGLTAVFATLLVLALALLTINCGSMTSVARPAAPAADSSSSGGSSGSGGSGTSSGGSSSSNHSTFFDLQAGPGWTGYALLPPAFAICQTCTPNGPEATWARVTGIASPSLSGNSARHEIGGQTPYADILWNNHLIGDFSSQGLPDRSRTIVPSLRHFVYDVYFYADNLPASQALEFDINQFVNGQSFIWGHECRIAGGHEWDIWNNQAQRWMPTGIPCNPVNNAWNHVVIQVERTSDEQLLFASITLNGQTSTLNHVENPGSAPTWYGITVNYQQDGNSKMQPYSIWLDKFHFTYW